MTRYDSLLEKSLLLTVKWCKAGRKATRRTTNRSFKRMDES